MSCSVPLKYLVAGILITGAASSAAFAADAQPSPDQTTPQAKPVTPIVPGPPGQTLSDKLSQTNGTVAPPSTKDSAMVKPTPSTNDPMPVITKPPAKSDTTTPPSANNPTTPIPK